MSIASHSPHPLHVIGLVALALIQVGTPIASATALRCRALQGTYHNQDRGYASDPIRELIADFVALNSVEVAQTYEAIRQDKTRFFDLVSDEGQRVSLEGFSLAVQNRLRTIVENRAIGEEGNDQLNDFSGSDADGARLRRDLVNRAIAEGRINRPTNQEFRLCLDFMDRPTIYSNLFWHEVGRRPDSPNDVGRTRFSAGPDPRAER